jgi:translation initiation factor 1
MAHRVDMKTGSTRGGLVYSTDGGRMCPACRLPVSACVCGKAKPSGAADGIVRVSRETKGRAGKGVTLVKGLAMEPAALAELGRRLKAACGTGGTVKDGVVELQGDHRAVVTGILREQGWSVKLSGD